MKCRVESILIVRVNGAQGKHSNNFILQITISIQRDFMEILQMHLTENINGIQVQGFSCLFCQILCNSALKGF